jgi:hypothetical protein
MSAGELPKGARQGGIFTVSEITGKMILLTRNDELHSVLWKA